MWRSGWAVKRLPSTPIPARSTSRSVRSASCARRRPRRSTSRSPTIPLRLGRTPPTRCSPRSRPRRGTRWGDPLRCPRPSGVTRAMTQEILMPVRRFPPNAPPAAGPYSPAVRAGDWLVLAGQVGLDPAGGGIVPGGVEAQARQVLREHHRGAPRPWRRAHRRCQDHRLRHRHRRSSPRSTRSTRRPSVTTAPPARPSRSRPSPAAPRSRSRIWASFPPWMQPGS